MNSVLKRIRPDNWICLGAAEAGQLVGPLQRVARAKDAGAVLHG